MIGAISQRGDNPRGKKKQRNRRTILPLTKLRKYTHENETAMPKILQRLFACIYEIVDSDRA